MMTPDANIILYAYNEDAPQHAKAKKWLEEQFSAPAAFGLSWQVMTAFCESRPIRKPFRSRLIYRKPLRSLMNGSRFPMSKS